MKIYLNATQNLKTVEDYILDIFSEPVTIYIPHYKMSKKTYTDSELTIVENKVARRSFEDLLNIINTNYNENSTKEELAKSLYSLWEKGSVKGLYCPDIHKIVFYGFKLDIGYYYKLVGGLYIKEYGVNYKGKGEYSLKEILDLAGFENEYLTKR